MNFHSLDYFLVLAREKNFTRAADVLHITQQSLSSHIANLERELNCTLVVRRTPLQLTYAGRTFLRYAESLQRTRQDMAREFCDISENQKGELRIGIAYTRGHAIMPRLIPAFQRAYPNVAVQLLESSNEGLQKMLLDNTVDLAIANFPHALPGIELEHFYVEDIVLCLTDTLLERFPVDLALCAQHAAQGDFRPMQNLPFLYCSAEDVAGRIGRELFHASDFQPRRMIRSENVETLLALCDAGEGVCLCPRNLVHTAIPPEHLSHLHVLPLSDAARYPMHFGYHSRSYQWSVISEFIRIAREQIESA